MAPTTAKKAPAPAARTTKPAAKKVPARAARTTKPAAEITAADQKSPVDRTAELSDEVLKAVEAGQRAAIEAVRKFVDTVDEVLPALGERPSRRETIIDAALDMADRLVTTQYNFIRNVVRSADRSLTMPGASKK
jgi:N-acetylglucosamine kinase-like BadF-type ATPase